MTTISDWMNVNPGWTMVVAFVVIAALLAGLVLLVEGSNLDG